MSAPRAGIAWGLVLSGAQISNVAHAEPRVTTVWYRSAAGCPDGAEFLARLEARALPARLARAGEPIDFVVTVGESPNGMKGVLERQTPSGTVAIRDLEAENCGEVTDAIALSLAVAATGVPGGAPQPVEAAPQTGGNAEPSHRAPGAEASPGAPAAAQSAPKQADPTPKRPNPPPHGPEPKGPSDAGHLWVGFGGGLRGGVAPVALPVGVAFAEYETGAGAVPKHAALRLGVSYASGESAAEALDARIASVRLQACPLRWGSGSVFVRPCLSVELGGIRAERTETGGQVDRALWASMGIGPRAGLRPADFLAVEVGLQGTLPFTRYEFAGTDPVRTLYRTASAGFEAEMGISVRLP